MGYNTEKSHIYQKIPKANNGTKPDNCIDCLGDNFRVIQRRNLYKHYEIFHVGRWFAKFEEHLTKLAWNIDQNNVRKEDHTWDDVTTS